MKLSEPDLALALSIAQSLGFDMELMSELLPNGIAGIMEVVNKENFLKKY